jgi:hypothetical protein
MLRILAEASMNAAGGAWDPLASAAAIREALSAGSGAAPEERFWQVVSGVSYLEASLLLAVGLVYLLYGFKIFRILVMVNAALLGAWAGEWASGRFGWPWWVALLGASALGVLAWPLMRYAVCLMGGLAGAFLGAMIARSAAPDATSVAVGAGIGLAVLGVLAFVIFRIVIICFTSLQGALLTVAGVVGLVARFEKAAAAVHAALVGRPYLLAILIGVPAVIGVVYQLCSRQRQDT